MASPFGLELTFRCSCPFLRKEDCLIVFVHWKLLLNGFRCLPSTTGQNEPQELLPEGWNNDPDVYELHYIKDGEMYFFKACIVDEQLAFTVLRKKDDEVISFVLDTTKWIGSNYQAFNEAFLDKNGLESFVQKGLIEKISPSKVKTSTPAPSQSFTTENAPSSGPAFSRPGPSSSFPVGPFAVGGGDLDPLGRGVGGGMLMDPRHTGQWRPQIGIPGNLPPGAVPPGARFDPFGPPDPDAMPPVRGPRPLGPRGGFGDPDPDHLRPPF